MRNLFIIFLLLLSNICFAKIAVDSSKAIQIQRQKIPQVKVNLPSTLQIENVSKPHDSINYKNMPWVVALLLGFISAHDKNMPWIVALIIGILSAFVNFWIGNRLRLSNEKKLLRQIETSKKSSI